MYIAIVHNWCEHDFCGEATLWFSPMAANIRMLDDDGELLLDVYCNPAPETDEDWDYVIEYGSGWGATEFQEANSNSGKWETIIS